jgi:hypothetical protein
MDLKIVLSRNPNAAYRLYDGQATIVLPEHAQVTVLNEVGSLVWDRIDGRRTLDEILESVLQEYDINRDQAERDIAAFVAALREHHMVS